jgi:mRNA interferase HicA
MKYSELLRILLRAGWVVKRQTGSHMRLFHADHEGYITFPNHGAKEIGKGLEKKIRKHAGL